MNIAFPLILTFSPEEKEQQLAISTFAKSSGPLAVYNSPRRWERFPLSASAESAEPMGRGPG
jgi:hypothetical protein